MDIDPDGNGYIVLPDETIWADTNGSDDTVDVALVGNRFYDLDNNTDVFTVTITCRYCLRFDFDCIPYPVREYIMAAAKYKFARSVRRELRLDAGLIADLQSDMALALTAARQFDNDTSNDNMLDTLPYTRVRGDTGAEVR